jgi:hypothetical protein
MLGCMHVVRIDVSPWHLPNVDELTLTGHFSQMYIGREILRRCKGSVSVERPAAATSVADREGADEGNRKMDYLKVWLGNDMAGKLTGLL